MKELSVFVDESGDFGRYDHRAPYYIVSLVLHDQSCDINAECTVLERSLADMGWARHCVHAGPIIRCEADYKGHTILERQKLLKRMVSFVRHLDVQFKSIVIEKSEIRVSDTLTEILTVTDTRNKLPGADLKICPGEFCG